MDKNYSVLCPNNSDSWVPPAPFRDWGLWAPSVESVLIAVVGRGHIGERYLERIGPHPPSSIHSPRPLACLDPHLRPKDPASVVLTGPRAAPADAGASSVVAQL